MGCSKFLKKREKGSFVPASALCLHKDLPIRREPLTHPILLAMSKCLGSLGKTLGNTDLISGKKNSRNMVNCNLWILRF